MVTELNWESARSRTATIRIWENGAEMGQQLEIFAEVAGERSKITLGALRVALYHHSYIEELILLVMRGQNNIHELGQ